MFYSPMLFNKGKQIKNPEIIKVILRILRGLGGSNS